VIVIGRPNSISEFSKDVAPKESLDQTQDFVIVGGSDIGFHTAKLLEERGLKTRLIEQDPDRARELLEEAGYGDGFDVVLTSPNGRYPNDRLVSEAIAGMWSEVGVNTTVNVMDWSPFVDGVLGKTHDAFFFLQIGVPLDASLSINFHAGNEGAAWQGYSNDEASQIIDEAITVLDREERNAMYRRLNHILYEECPWVYLWNSQGLVGAREEVQDWEPHPDGVLHLVEHVLRITGRPAGGPHRRARAEGALEWASTRRQDRNGPPPPDAEPEPLREVGLHREQVPRGPRDVVQCPDAGAWWGADERASSSQEEARDAVVGLAPGEPARQIDDDGFPLAERDGVGGAAVA
jgi:hypothetical protein